MSHETPDLRKGLRAALDGEAAERERARLKQEFERDETARERARELRTAQAEPTPGLSLDAHEEAQESVRAAHDAPFKESSDARPVTKPVLPKAPAMPAIELGGSATDASRAAGVEPASRTRLLLIGVLLLMAVLTVAIVVAANSGSRAAATSTAASTASAARSGATIAAPSTDSPNTIATARGTSSNAAPSATIEPTRSASPRASSDHPATPSTSKSTSSSPDWF